MVLPEHIHKDVLYFTEVFTVFSHFMYSWPNNEIGISPIYYQHDEKMYIFNNSSSKFYLCHCIYLLEITCNKTMKLDFEYI